MKIKKGETSETVKMSRLVGVKGIDIWAHKLPLWKQLLSLISRPVTYNYCWESSSEATLVARNLDTMEEKVSVDSWSHT